MKNQLQDGDVIQCPCGAIIKDPKGYKLIFLRRGAMEVDILCPNDACYLKELGYIKFELNNGKPKFKKAEFYPPFVTWNTGRLGYEKTLKILKEHLRKIVTEIIDWDKLKETFNNKQKDR